MCCSAGDYDKTPRDKGWEAAPRPAGAFAGHGPADYPSKPSWDSPKIGLVCVPEKSVGPAPPRSPVKPFFWEQVLRASASFKKRPGIFGVNGPTWPSPPRNYLDWAWRLIFRESGPGNMKTMASNKWVMSATVFAKFRPWFTGPRSGFGLKERGTIIFPFAPEPRFFFPHGCGKWGWRDLPAPEPASGFCSLQKKVRAGPEALRPPYQPEGRLGEGCGDGYQRQPDLYKGRTHGRKSLLSPAEPFTPFLETPVRNRPGPSIGYFFKRGPQPAKTPATVPARENGPNTGPFARPAWSHP